MTSPANSANQPRAGLAASSGLGWWSSAMAWLFGSGGQLGVWALMTLAYCFLSALLHLIPLIGFVASIPLNFVFTGGLMWAAGKSARGIVPPFGDLFAGFGPRAGQLVAAGVLIFIACMAVFGLMFLVGVWAALSALASGILTRMTLPDPASWGIGLGTAAVLVLCVLALIPISMAAWLAPALIMQRGVPPVDALRLSLAACQRNLGALTVYGLVGILLAMLATVMLMVGWLVVLPLILLSSYAAFQDLFAAQLEALPAA